MLKRAKTLRICLAPMQSIAFGLFMFSIVYAVYTASITPIPEADTEIVERFLERIPGNGLFLPVRAVCWVFCLPWLQTSLAYVLSASCFCMACLVQAVA